MKHIVRIIKFASVLLFGGGLASSLLASGTFFESFNSRVTGDSTISLDVPSECVVTINILASTGAGGGYTFGPPDFWVIQSSPPNIVYWSSPVISPGPDYAWGYAVVSSGGTNNYLNEEMRSTDNLSNVSMEFGYSGAGQYLIETYGSQQGTGIIQADITIYW